jgi:hypothetical protein
MRARIIPRQRNGTITYLRSREGRDSGLTGSKGSAQNADLNIQLRQLNDDSYRF